MRYRSRPQEVEAIQWRGDNHFEIGTFGAAVIWNDGQGLRLLAGKDGAQDFVPVPEGHWIVRAAGDLSDHWPVDPDYFAAKYEPVDGGESS